MPSFWMLPRGSATEDSSPTPFAWDNNITNATPNGTYASSIETITGINVPAPISVVGGQYRINGGPYTAAPGFVGLNDTVQVARQASPANATSVTVTLNVGGFSLDFTITTVAAISTFYSIFGPYVSWATETALGGQFPIMQNRILTLRRNNRVWDDTLANYGYADVLWMALERGGTADADWNTDAVNFLNGWMAVYPQGEAGEQHRMNIGPAIAHFGNKSNGVQAKALLDRSASLSGSGDNLWVWSGRDAGISQSDAFNVNAGDYGPRIHHKIWEQCIIVKLIGSTTRDWVQRANWGKEGFINGLDTEGNLPAYGRDQKGGPSKHWQNALVCRSAILHYTHIAADPAIIDAVERAAESAWRQRLRIGTNVGGMPYMNRGPEYIGGHADGTMGASNDLIYHWMDVYGWLAWIRGDTTWITRADLFQINANQSWINTTIASAIKNYDEDFAMFTWRYSYWKINAAMTTSRPVNTVAPALLGTMANGQTITAVAGTYPNGVTSRLWRFYRFRNALGTAEPGGGGWFPATGYQVGNAYTLTAEDVGCYMFACEACTNAAGRGAEALTPMYGPVTS